MSVLRASTPKALREALDKEGWSASERGTTQAICPDCLSKIPGAAYDLDDIMENNQTGKTFRIVSRKYYKTLRHWSYTMEGVNAKVGALKSEQELDDYFTCIEEGGQNGTNDHKKGI